jgi:F-type H+-transporting ATPase subunit b
MRHLCWIVMMVAGLALAGGQRAAAEQAAAEAEHEGPAAAEHAEAAGHGGEHEDLGHGNASPNMGKVEAIAGDLSIYTFVVFLVLLAILSRAAWPKISEALLERERRIEGAIADAAAKHEEAKRLLAEHEARLAGAAAEVRAMLDEARRDADATKAQIVAEAREAAKQEHQRAQRDIEVAVDAATKNLAELSANLAVDLAGKAIRETINPAKAQELVREALTGLSAAAPSRN